MPNGYNDKKEGDSAFWTIFISFFPVLLLVGLFWFLMSQAQGGGSRVMQFGKSRAKLATKDTPKVTFADVAGADEAVEELHEIKEFLAEPAKFLAVGAKIPKGVLLYGPPGTGKTLLARAVAGEAGVPFYSISGSDFVEMFVGVGASRVRDLFEQAKANAPAIVFVDEIDAVGRHRGAGLGGGHDEREQTLNQLLVEMDGFDVKTNVILIAATNRPDILDPALLRPGRFDRQIAVEAPDMIGRHRILEVHGQGKPLATGVDLLAVARRTPGFTGADLANVLNEAALLTARTDKKLIDDEVLDEAIDRVIAGPQKRTRIMSAKERKITAYHEGGHALVAAAMNHTRPGHQGHDPAARSGPRLHDGDADRRQVLHHPQRDPRPARLRARRPRRGGARLPRPDHRRRQRHREGHRRWPARWSPQYGMSERVGAIKLGQSQGEVFLGRDMGHQRDYSEEVAARRRRGGPPAHRGRPRRGLGDPRREPRRPRPPRARAAREGDAQQGGARGDLRPRREAAGAAGLALQRAPLGVRTSRRCSPAGEGGAERPRTAARRHRGERAVTRDLSADAASPADGASRASRDGRPARVPAYDATRGPRPRSGSCSSPSARTRTATGCATPRPGSRGRTRSSSRGCGRSPRTS